VVERDWFGGQPQWCAQQWRSFDRGGFWVIAGRANSQIVPVITQVVPDAEPLLFAAGELTGQGFLARGVGGLQAEDAVAMAPGQRQACGTW
jgi:hypothetical protein